MAKIRATLSPEAKLKIYYWFYSSRIYLLNSVHVASYANGRLTKSDLTSARAFRRWSKKALGHTFHLQSSYGKMGDVYSYFPNSTAAVEFKLDEISWLDHRKK